MVNENGKAVLALVWYATCTYKRVGRNKDGRQVLTGLGDGTVPLSATAQWLIALVDFVPSVADEEEQEDDDDEEEEEEEDKDAYLRLCEGGSFTSLAILGHIVKM